MKPVLTLVLLADDREARFLLNDGVGKGLRQIGHLAGGDSAAGFADQPGRSQAAPGAARHGVEPVTPEEVQRRDAFAGQIADEAARLWQAEGAGRLVMAAPAKMLGELRGRMPAPLTAALAGDLAKDLVHVPQADLPKHFADIAAF